MPPRSRASRPAPAAAVRPARPAVALNLDELEKENPTEPFVVTVGGQEITFIDVRDLPWDEVAKLSLEDPDDFMWKTLSEEDYDYFMAAKVPAWKIRTLIADYLRHFGLSSPGNGRGSRT